MAQKKLLVELEQSAEVRRLATALATRQTPDFEAWETLMLQAARQGGAGVLGSLLNHWQAQAPKKVVLCACGERMNSRGRRGKGLLTTLGAVPFARSFYQCHQGRFPDDERLDISNTTYSPGVRRLMARAGSQTQFEQAAEDLLCYAGLNLKRGKSSASTLAMAEAIRKNPGAPLRSERRVAALDTHWLKPCGQLFALRLPHEDDAITQTLGAAGDLCSWPTEDIEAGAFQESGTHIRTSLLLLEKSTIAAQAKVVPILPPTAVLALELSEAKAAPPNDSALSVSTHSPEGRAQRNR